MAPPYGSHVKYISTRGAAPALGFEDVLLTGLARDGGLYLPERWPAFSHDDIAALGRRIVRGRRGPHHAPFVGGEIPDDELAAIVKDAYATFRHRLVAPLVQIGPSDWMLELFHGPTLAFKDVAMQVLSRLMDRALTRRKRSRDDRRRDLRRHGRRRDRGLPRPRRDRHLHPVPARPRQRRPAPPDDDADRGQRPRHRHRRHLRRLPEHREGAVQRPRVARPPRARRRQLDQLGAADGPDRLLLHVRRRARRARSDRSASPCRPAISATCFAGYAAKRMGLPIDRLVIATNVNDILVRTLRNRPLRDA